MNKEEILYLIKTKIKEHLVEVDGTDELTARIKREISAAKKDLTNGDKSVIIKAKGIMELGQKMSFHKTCIAILNDLLEEIEK